MLTWRECWKTDTLWYNPIPNVYSALCFPAQCSTSELNTHLGLLQLLGSWLDSNSSSFSVNLTFKSKLSLNLSQMDPFRVENYCYSTILRGKQNWKLKTTTRYFPIRLAELGPSMQNATALDIKALNSNQLFPIHTYITKRKLVWKECLN